MVFNAQSTAKVIPERILVVVAAVVVVLVVVVVAVTFLRTTLARKGRI